MSRRFGLSAAAVFLILQGLDNLFFTILSTVASVYAIVSADLDPLQLVLVGTVLEVTTLVFEVPTGVVADMVSRRLSIIVGVFLTGVGFVVWGSFPRFETILAAQVMWAIGYTFTSGADVAWITDEVGEEAARPLYLKAAQVGQVGALVGIGVSVALASIALWVPLVVSGVLFIGLAGFLVVVMPESNFQRVSREASPLVHFGATLRGGVGVVRARPALMLIFAITAFQGAASEGFDRLWTLHVIRSFAFPALGDLEPVVWFGIIEAVGLVLSVGATEFIKRRGLAETAGGAARALAVVSGLLVASVLTFALAGIFAVALIALWSVSVLREIQYPLYRTWINAGLDSRTRATVNSMGSQMDAFGQIAGGPVLGVLAAARGVRAAIAASGLIGAPGLLLFSRAIRADRVPTV